MPDNATNRQTWIWAGSIGAIAVLISFLGMSLASRHEPLLSSVDPGLRPQGPWSEVWDRSEARSVLTTVPFRLRSRPLTVRSLRNGENLYMLIEWHDEHPDLSYEGVLYNSWLKSGKEIGPMTTLLRDEVNVWFGPVYASGPLNGAMADEKNHGHWVWRSQDQRDLDQDFIDKAQKEFGIPYVNYYPILSTGAYAARYVGNTNAILGARSSCQWVVKPAQSVYIPAISVPLQGKGQWRDDTWRVMFEVPVASLSELGDRLEVVMSIADGGQGERKAERTISQPLVLDISPRAEGVGK